MGSVALKMDEPEPFALEVHFDGGDGAAVGVMPI